MVIGFAGSWDGLDFVFAPQLTPGFKAVTNIIGLPSLATVGIPLTLSGTVVPSDAANKTITWTVLTAGATVSGNTFTASTTGYKDLRARITGGLEANDFTLTFSIRVLPAPVLPTVTSVTPSGTGAAVSGDLVITFSEAMDTATAGTVRLNSLAALTDGAWSSGDTVCTIAYSGLANSTEYTVNISGFKDAAGNTMTDDSSCSFTTVAGGTTPPGGTTVPVEGVTLSKTTLSLKVGETEQLLAIIAPSDATSKDVTWTSSNTSVSTVDVTGKVTAVTQGSATITVTTEDGNKTASCVVTVTQGGSSTTIIIDLSDLGLENGVLKLDKNEPINVQIEATPAGTTFTSNGLPPGLTLTTGGLLSGSVPAPGTYKVTITATAPDGTTVTQIFDIEVSEDQIKVTSGGGGCDTGVGFAALALALWGLRRR